MDVWFCEGRNHRREAQLRAADSEDVRIARSSVARVRRIVFSLDNLNGPRGPLQGMKMGVVRQYNNSADKRRPIVYLENKNPV
jgi:hypothetical protein